MWLLLFAACTGPLGGASDGPDSGDSGGSPATVEVGGGATTFEPVSDGVALTMVHGPQGGWHVLASARLLNIDPIVFIHYTIEVVPDGVVVADNTYHVQIVEDAAGGGYYPGMYGYLDVGALADGELDTPPELLAGKELLVRMDVGVVLEEVLATDTLTGVATLDPQDEEPDSGVAP